MIFTTRYSASLETKKEIAMQVRTKRQPLSITSDALQLAGKGTMNSVYNDKTHHRVWHCDACEKEIVLPPKKVWVKCDCGENLKLRPVCVLDGPLAVRDEKERERAE